MCYMLLQSFWLTLWYSEATWNTQEYYAITGKLHINQIDCLILYKIYKKNMHIAHGDRNPTGIESSVLFVGFIFDVTHLLKNVFASHHLGLQIVSCKVSVS